MLDNDELSFQLEINSDCSIVVQKKNTSVKSLFRSLFKDGSKSPRGSAFEPVKKLNKQIAYTSEEWLVIL